MSTTSIDPADEAERAFDKQHREWELRAFMAQIASVLLLLVSLVVVFYQIRLSNRIASRAEANSTQVEWTALRSSIYGSRETASLLLAGTTQELSDPVERLQFQYLIREMAWATFQLWDRVTPLRGSKTRFVASAGDNFLRVVCRPGAIPVWRDIKRELPPKFVSDLDERAASYATRHKVRCS